MAADLNIFDLETVTPDLPELLHDLPGGARRLRQTATGFLATIVNGEVLLDRGEPTGATPGQLLRGPWPVARRRRGLGRGGIAAPPADRATGGSRAAMGSEHGERGGAAPRRLGSQDRIARRSK